MTAGKHNAFGHPMAAALTADVCLKYNLHGSGGHHRETIPKMAHDALEDLRWVYAAPPGREVEYLMVVDRAPQWVPKSHVDDAEAYLKAMREAAVRKMASQHALANHKARKDASTIFAEVYLNGPGVTARWHTGVGPCGRDVVLLGVLTEAEGAPKGFLKIIQWCADAPYDPDEFLVSLDGAPIVKLYRVTKDHRDQFPKKPTTKE